MHKKQVCEKKNKGKIKKCDKYLFFPDIVPNFAVDAMKIPWAGKHVSIFGNVFQPLEEAMQEMQNDFQELEKAMQEMQNDFRRLENGMHEMQNHFQELENGLQEMRNGKIRW